MADRMIWRDRLDLRKTSQFVQLPPGSRILTVQRRIGEAAALDLWADVDPAQPARMLYRVQLVGTGARPPLHESDGGDMRYVSTVQLDDGALVMHVYAQFVQPGEAR